MNCPSRENQEPGSASSLRRHVALLMQHHRPVERGNHALQPVSPASYGSSLEVTPYNPAVTPSSSVGFKGRIGEPGYSLKTSTELLKVLNRIWSLEEQHASNISLVRALKKELDHARIRIKELVRDQQTDRHEIDELMKQIAEDKLARKSKEQDRINVAIQSAREELEDERKLRKRSESLHRKLARELYEVKTSFATALKELENEKRSRTLLEDLCDEFAWGIRDSHKELHALRQKFDKDSALGAAHDSLTLHMSESWLDERMQIKLEPQFSSRSRTTVVDKMRSEIEAFLQVKQNEKSNGYSNHLPPRDVQFHRHPLESTPLNVAVSAPQHDDDEDSASSDSHCFELHKPTVDLKSQENVIEEDQSNSLTKQSRTKKKLSSDDKAKSRGPSSLQVKHEEQMAHVVSHGESKDLFNDLTQGIQHEANPMEMGISKKSETCEATGEGSTVRRITEDEIPGSNSNSMIDNLIRSHYLLSESISMHPEQDHELASGGSSVWRARASPVRQWTERLPPQEHEISESSSKLPTELKENTLKAKLMEARTKGTRARSRLKGSKILF
ncbi:OLC1v1029929C1 [Oldenlandia corymbosa var. corymbosa]|uniref:OLC1v1029929C1 n=1 Tax=Oldenlandia corymbosa var. corymbosa TaxID=529605 RepID=A0AAV1CHW3_OLDCO|nr:OLC1v1029929C1 [Oldenlandia corymbosa var. corymbosa]